MSEKYQDRKKLNWSRDVSGKTMIWVVGDLHITKKMSVPAPGFTWVEVAGMRILCCYLPSSDNFDEFFSSVDAIVDSARCSEVPLVIGEDFNAWAEEWKSGRVECTRTN